MSRGASRSDLIADFKRVASELNEVPSTGQYQEHGQYSKSTLYREFDSIYEARDAAGLDSGDQRGDAQTISRAELLTAIHELHDELSRPPQRDDMIELGDYSEGPFRREFGSWGAAVVEAGYEPHRPNNDLAEYQTVTCTWCDATEEVLSSNVQNQANWFCSRECKHEWQSENVVGESHHQYERITVTCETCGEEFDRKPAVVERRELHFCGTDCYGT